jgi:hypothetical protein
MTPYGSALGTTYCEVGMPLPVTMRSNGPTSVEYAGLRTYDGATFQTVNSVTLATYAPAIVGLQFTVTAGLVLYRPTIVATTTSNPATSYIGFSAEL